MIKSVIIRTAIVIVVIIVVVLGKGFFYYKGVYSPPPSEMPSYEQIVIAAAAPSTDFSDIYEEGEGIILIDLVHENAFDIEELNVLTSRLISRGLTIELFSA